ncbi:ethanolamine ammonia-lyase subunit EutC [Limoniibacter endophyticus]|uniref:Ethanolamine ammonia-lyase small subunit n=1 Tax=Limoniibacter endophyticus TaxID=1565040 RepID=A0A8J3GH47_9HYPH|nr:ethanolamine ammonia-lyase subunit EutC [Limoniibacter endophyticus]GHC69064.1 ethanolamine ammonia-lyase light chain [Limoniibacter endophyticus]
MSDRKPAKTDDNWRNLAQFTDARIAMGRSGSAIPTHAVLDFAYAHALARDAVHTGFDPQSLIAFLQSHTLEALQVQSAAKDRATYLRRPDLGRKLDPESKQALVALNREPGDIAIIIADGLSATAVSTHTQGFLASFIEATQARRLTLAPVCLVENGRVAIGDEIGAILEARLAIVLIGERPGLSSADSLGAYITYAPRPGRNDAERNCISNIRDNGLRPHLAAQKAIWLIDQAFDRQISGVNLKDESDQLLTSAADYRSIIGQG